MGLFRFVTGLFRAKGYVGKDLVGNKFYEHVTPFGESSLRKTRRVVQYAAKSSDMWDAVTSQKRLAIQWQAWLSHTRIDPPSVVELQQDEARKTRLQINVARLKAQDEELRGLQASEDAPTLVAPLPTAEPTPLDADLASPSEHAVSGPEVLPQAQPSQLPDVPVPQTESWAPRSARSRQAR
ncbi:hypothetical protein BKA62DRAFT_491686 [Auriculariales sp. MPI-PUGE-AT-0066]|nr:hypothetical protein BKA62DRAFT_491686 [Auriculariales sp. MPI-PUGE-AT-0066]